MCLYVCVCVEHIHVVDYDNKAHIEGAHIWLRIERANLSFYLYWIRLMFPYRQISTQTAAVIKIPCLRTFIAFCFCASGGGLSDTDDRVSLNTIYKGIFFISETL